MKGVNNLRVMTTGLCLSVSLLTGCSNDNEIKFGQSTVNYESENQEGTISYEDLNNCCKIVTIENNGITGQRLLMNVQNLVILKGSTCNIVKYIDLKNGETIIEYHDYSPKAIIWIVGENLTIIEEKDITGYLLQEDFIKKEYAVEEVLTFFEEKILPTLDSSEKELVK